MNGHRAGKIAVRTAAGLLVVVLTLVFGVAPYLLTRRMMTGRIVFTDRENQGLTPGSFDLPFEDVTLTAPDGVRLSGWSVPAPGARGSVVLVHGLNRSRIEMARKLPFLHAHGFAALLLDLRHHGQSAGNLSSFGYFEKKDVEAAVAEAKRRVPGPAVVWGVSLGAASAMLAAAEDPDVAAVVCDSTYRSLPDTVRHHLSMVRELRSWTRLLPAGLLAEEVLFWIKRQGGFDPSQVDVVAAASHLRGRPVLFVCNSGDKRMPKEIAFELKEVAGPHARVLVVPGHSHGGAYREGAAAYEHAVGELLDELTQGSQDQTSGGSVSEKEEPKPVHNHDGEDDGEARPPEETGSYSMVDPRFRELYFRFYKETYKPSALDRKTKELIAIASSINARCQGCLDGHIQKALKIGATREEIGETIAIAIGVSAAAIVDMTDHAARRLNIKLY